MSGPKIPSQAKIKRDAKLEEERVRFENEKRLFIERVGSYETIASERIGAARGTFESAPIAPLDPDSIHSPLHFNPSFDPQQYSGFADADLSWFTAPNLGLNYDRVYTGDIAPPPGLDFSLWIPDNRRPGSSPGFGRGSW